MIARIIRWLMLLAFVAALVFAYGVYTRRIAVPEQYDPFAPLDVRAPPGPLTALKLWRTTHDPRLCDAALAQSGLQYRPIADTSGPGGCELKDVVRVTQSADVRFSAPFLATCPLALGMAFFEHQYLQPAAIDVFGERVTRIEHVGSYACRNVNHQKDAALSQHASANAIDLTGFVLANGRRITLARWDDDAASPDAVFLRRIHDGACRSFDATLGPDYNALHKTHFHVDMGPYRMCR
ncbi:extensin family protein [Caballeronia sp. LZ062]|uniref:extensin-like domain-containing protein n=1 Tax=unclassified Caballeronia TaxID=2646786 RepID=UPI002855C09E|nr:MULTISPECIES: extensin family protein [unclassified Caballeronia]MDR5857483.1 extensin family protein [Caballeronia sp. LZ050]MDR5869033.1 extensin family protein [Caballeronia sp. LZ062]